MSAVRGLRALDERQREAHACAAGESSSQMRPPWASTMAREIASPRPAPVARSRRLGSAAEERLEEAPAVGGVNALAGVGDLDLDLVAGGIGADRHGTVGGGVTDRVLDQVEEHALQLFSGWPGPRASPGRAAARTVTCLASACAASRRPSRRRGRRARHARGTSRVARLEPRELEQVVDQRRRARRGASHCARVARAVAASTSRRRSLDQQPQRGDRRPQVV